MQASPPSNQGFMVAAYVVTAVIVLGYAWGLWARAARMLRGRGRDAAPAE